MGLVAYHYSKGLFAVPVSPYGLRQRLQDLEVIEQVWRTNPAFQLGLTTPTLTIQQKAAKLRTLFQGKIDETLLAFFTLLVKRKHLFHLPLILHDYRHLVHERLGILEVNLITTEPAQESTKAELKHKLERSYQKQINLKETLDLRILGGAILILGHQILDGSLRYKLQRLKQTLLTQGTRYGSKT